MTISTYKLYSIKYVGPHTYEVVLQRDGESAVSTCKVDDADGIVLVQCEPDILTLGVRAPREIYAAIAAVDRARET